MDTGVGICEYLSQQSFFLGIVLLDSSDEPEILSLESLDLNVELLRFLLKKQEILDLQRYRLGLVLRPSL